MHVDAFSAFEGAVVDVKDPLAVSSWVSLLESWLMTLLAYG